jgi:hypothetical protein
MAVPRTLVALILTACFIATACSASGGSPGGSPSAAGQGLPSGDAGAVAIGTASSRSLGTFLTGPNSMTLYTHAGDGTTQVTYGGLPLYDWQGDPKPDDTPVTSRPRGAQS